MKKLLALVVAAAIIGVIVSRVRKPRPESNGPSGAAAQAAPASGTAAQARVPLSAAVAPGQGAAGTRAAHDVPAGSASAGSARPSPAGLTASSQAVPASEGHRSTPAPSAPSISVSADASRLPPQDAQLARAKELLDQGNRVEARRILSQIYRSGDQRLRSEALVLLNQINKDLVFNPQCVAGAQVHVVQKGEVLVTIARKYNVNWHMIARLNNIARPELLRERQQLKILSGTPEILVDKSDFRLALFMGTDFIKEYAVGLGKDNSTPAGTFAVDEMLVRADWYPPGGGVIHYGQPGHLIGERWIGFLDKPGATGLGIHGTNQPETISRMSSNGCIRMLNEDVIELYDFLRSGITVNVVD